MSIIASIGDAVAAVNRVARVLDTIATALTKIAGRQCATCGGAGSVAVPDHPDPCKCLACKGRGY